MPQPTFGGPTAEDIKANLAAREAHIRESWIRAMEVRLVRAELQKCYKAEGVNHLQVCKALAERYLKMTRENKLEGYTVIGD